MSTNAKPTNTKSTNQTNAPHQTNPASPVNLSLNQKIAELDQQVEWFYGEDFALEKATDRYKKALELAKDIEQDLETLKNEVEVLATDFSK